jgi:hypothetical protein
VLRQNRNIKLDNNTAITYVAKIKYFERILTKFALTKKSRVNSIRGMFAAIQHSVDLMPFRLVSITSEEGKM